MVEKKELRQTIQQLLKNIPIEEFEEKGLLLSLNLAHFLEDLKKTHPHLKMILGVFSPMKNEPNFLQKLGEYEDCFAFPSLKNRDRSEMVFRKSRSEDLKENHDFGVKISVPSLDKEEVVPNIIIVPGLLFSRRGGRLGRGGGYYDRYLRHLEALKVGICLNEQLSESFPVEEHDIDVDLIITNQEIINNNPIRTHSILDKCTKGNL